MFVHDTPAEPGSWRYVRKREEADLGFKNNPDVRAFFFGHSHQPGVWTPEHFMVAEPGRKFDFSERVMVNVGSVGQPRDRDPRACFVLLNEPEGSIEFVRVPYDIEAAQAKILAAGLPPVLAARLATGE